MEVMLWQTPIFNYGRLMIQSTAAKKDGRASVSQDLDVNAKYGTASSGFVYESNKFVFVGCSIYQGSLSATNLKASNDNGILKASGETFMIPTMSGGWGEASATTSPVQSIKNVYYGSTLHAAMRAELNGGVATADVTKL